MTFNLSAESVELLTVLIANDIAATRANLAKYKTPCRIACYEERLQTLIALDEYLNPLDERKIND
jgi:hypothetical protein